MPVTNSATGISSLISGQVSGIDVPAAIDGLLSVKKFEISQLQKKQDIIVTKQAALSAINDAVAALRSTSINMSKSASFFSYTASLSSSSAAVAASSLLDVSGTSSLASGQHSIVISQIAQAERLSSSSAVKDSSGVSINGANAALNLSGSFQIAGVSVTIGTSDSLNSIAANINQLNLGASATGVAASVMKVGANDYRLILASDTTGVAGFTLTGIALDAVGSLAGLQLGSSGGNAFQTLQTAQDAQLSIDGLALIRTSNTITDALSGVTLSLKQADPTATVNMNISVDKVTLRNSVQAFVDSYNNVQTLIANQFKFDPKTGLGGVLAGDPLIKNIQSTMASSLLKSVPGLTSDKNSLVMIGVEPDKTGKLKINASRFDTFLANDPNAIRDLFVVQGSSSNSNLSLLVNGLSTPSGAYSVNITQAATLASLTGTTNLSLPLAASDVVTLTDTTSARKAIINLLAGQTQSQVLAALNAELSATYTEKHQLSTALTAAGSPATGSTTFSALGLSVTAGDTISITGTLRSGGAVNSTFSVLDPAVDTVSGLLTAIQTAFNQEVTATIDANGKITLVDVNSGDSQLTVGLTANTAGALNFGTDVIVTEGRYAMSIQAVLSGNVIRMESTFYGSSTGFSMTGLGLSNQLATGMDVAGSINGLSATGSGQTLTGSSGNADGMALFYTGSTTGVVGDITLGVGVASAYDGLLDTLSNPVYGLIQNSVQSEQTTFDSLTKHIEDSIRLMDQQRVTLTRQFAGMQKALATLQQSSDFLAQQTNAQNRRY